MSYRCGSISDAEGRETISLISSVRSFRPRLTSRTNAGMSTRAIAPVVGVSQKTASRDVLAGESHDSPDPQTRERRTATIQSGAAWVEPGQEVPIDTETVIDRDTGEVLSERKITGLDGKTYTRNEPTKPKRAPPLARIMGAASSSRARPVAVPTRRVSPCRRAHHAVVHRRVISACPPARAGCRAFARSRSATLSPWLSCLHGHATLTPRSRRHAHRGRAQSTALAAAPCVPRSPSLSLSCTRRRRCRAPRHTPPRRTLSCTTPHAARRTLSCPQRARLRRTPPCRHTQRCHPCRAHRSQTPRQDAAPGIPHASTRHTPCRAHETAQTQPTHTHAHATTRNPHAHAPATPHAHTQRTRAQTHTRQEHTQHARPHTRQPPPHPPPGGPPSPHATRTPWGVLRLALCTRLGPSRYDDIRRPSRTWAGPPSAFFTRVCRRGGRTQSRPDSRHSRGPRRAHRPIPRCSVSGR